MIQSVDSVELLRKLDAAAGESGRSPELLVQVDLAGEATKYGVRPDEVPRHPRGGRVMPGGDGSSALMTLPPIPDNPEDARPWFRRLQELRDSGWPAASPRPCCGKCRWE